MNSARLQNILLTLSGPDRLGLLDAVASSVNELGGNWLESRIMRLRGHFSGLLHITLPVGKSEDLDAALQKIDGLGAQLITLKAPRDDESEAQSLNASLELTGYDRPGIVRTVTRLLKAQDVDIDSFDSELRRAPMSGEPTFYAKAQLRLQPGTTSDTLAQALERLGSDLMVDVQIEAQKGGERTPEPQINPSRKEPRAQISRRP